MPDAHEPSPPRRRGDRRRKLGALGEQLAVEHLRRLDFVIVERNARTRYGEIDLIAVDGEGTLVFAEVKTRLARKGRRGVCPEEQPLAWLKASQQRRLRRLAHAWLYETTAPRPRSHTIRFDAIGVVVDSRSRLLRLDHIEGAW